MTPALQLDVENSLAAYLATLSIPGLTAANIYPVHAKNKIAPDTHGTYLAIIADPPDWEDGVNFASLIVAFELATGGLTDHDNNATLSAAHQTRIAAIIELLSQQKFEATKAALNASVAAIQVIGWEQNKPGTDGTSEDGSQLVTRLAYVFDVFLTA